MSLFGGCKNGCNDSLLWFIILFILLFYSGFGGRNDNGCCCNINDDCERECNRCMR